MEKGITYKNQGDINGSGKYEARKHNGLNGGYRNRIGCLILGLRIFYVLLSGTGREFLPTPTGAG
jgi:hypothetical protein